MTIAYFCIFFAIFIPIFCAGYAKFSGKGYNNRSPREYLEKTTGAARRAHYAQLNAYEAFPPFAAAVIVSQHLHAPQPLINGLALTFIAARVFYTIFYMTDNHALRSLAWFIGFGATAALFLINI